MGPDERVFRTHIAQGLFQSGVDHGRWQLESIEWPYALIVVKAAEREHAPEQYTLRFECKNYPQSPPTAQLWDLEKNGPLAYGQWPAGHKRVSPVFRPDWKDGQCLYLPCDRLSIEGHAAWHSQHPSMIWTASSDITLYLRIVHELLNSNDYSGIRRS